MFSVRHDFGISGRIFGIPRAWLSRIGAFCSSFSTRGRLINISIPDNPSPNKAPVVFEINEDALRAFVIDNAPSSDPTIPTNVLTDDDIGTTVAAANHNHDSAYAAKSHNHSGVYQPAGNYAAANHNHSGLVTSTGAAGLRFVVFENNATSTSIKSITLDNFKYTADNHSGTCLIKVDANGNVSHTGNKYYDALDHLVGSFNATNKYFDSLTTGPSTGSRVSLDKGSIHIYRSQYPAIGFHWNNKTASTAVIQEGAEGILIIDSPGHARLVQGPITDPSETGYHDRQIATVGSTIPKPTLESGESLQTTTRTVYGKVVWDPANHKLTQKVEKWTFRSGLLVKVANDSDITIDTASLITWS